MAIDSTSPATTAFDARTDAVHAVGARLAREYAARLPTATVLRCVRAAGDAVRLFGEDPERLPAVLECIARADLQQVIDGHDSGARVYGVRRRPRAAAEQDGAGS